MKHHPGRVKVLSCSAGTAQDRTDILTLLVSRFFFVGHIEKDRGQCGEGLLASLGDGVTVILVFFILRRFELPNLRHAVWGCAAARPLWRGKLLSGID